jgi:hypothetical protein
MKCRKPRSRASRVPWVLAVGCAVGFIWTGVALSAGSKDKPDEFRNGILAARNKDWARSAEFMRKANDKQVENGEPARVGSRFVAYLPLYHLGLALYKLNHCPDALVAWRASLDLGAVTSSPDELKYLRQYQQDCLSRH